MCGGGVVKDGEEGSKDGMEVVSTAIHRSVYRHLVATSGLPSAPSGTVLIEGSWGIGSHSQDGGRQLTLWSDLSPPSLWLNLCKRLPTSSGLRKVVPACPAEPC